MRAPRASRRQTGPFVFVLAGLMLAGAGLAVVVNWPLQPRELVTVAAFPGLLVGLIYLLAFTVRVLVTSQHVRIDGAFRRTDVPRHLVVGVDVDVEMLTGGLVVAEGDQRRRIAVPAVFRRYTGDPTSIIRRLKRDSSELTEMLTSVPAGPPSGSVVSRLRLLNIGIAVGEVSVLLWLLFFGAVHLGR